MNEILTSLPGLAGSQTQLLVLAGLFVGILMVTLGGALALTDRDNVERRLALAHGDQRAAVIEVRHAAEHSSKLGRWWRQVTNANAWRYASGLFRLGFEGLMRSGTIT